MKRKRLGVGKHRRWPAAVAVGTFLWLLHVGSAFAENGEDPPILSALLVPAQLAVRLAILVNETFGLWVSDNYTLTEPLGDKLVCGVAVIIPALADFWAQVLNIF